MTRTGSAVTAPAPSVAPAPSAVVAPRTTPAVIAGQVPSGRARRSVRLRVALRCGAAAAWLSRAAHLGRGQMIGGRIVLTLAPDALAQLSTGRRIVLVTGTNGKTTTTRMLAEAISSTGDRVATNATGANMPDGLVAALLAAPRARTAVLEIDECYLPTVAAATRPAMMLLLNLTRDQLDRVGEVRILERRLRAAVNAATDCTVVSNVDDVLTCSAASDARRVVRVGAGTGWTADSQVCPRCFSMVRRGSGPSWSCGCPRQEPMWTLAGSTVLRHGTTVGQVQLSLPGKGNRANALMAVAAANALGVPVPSALKSLRVLRDIDGRFGTVAWQGHDVHLLLAKNPASWREILAIMTARSQRSRRSVVLCVEARAADGLDTSWLWDVPFEQLRGVDVVATGSRAADLAVRLDYAGVDHRIVDDPRDAVATCSTHDVDVAATYSAFRKMRGWMADERH